MAEIIKAPSIRDVVNAANIAGLKVQEIDHPKFQRAAKIWPEQLSGCDDSFFIVVIDQGKVLTGLFSIHVEGKGFYQLANMWNRAKAVGPLVPVADGYGLFFHANCAHGLTKEYLVACLRYFSAECLAAFEAAKTVQSNTDS